jgi:hypothetical protein
MLKVQACSYGLFTDTSVSDQQRLLSWQTVPQQQGMQMAALTFVLRSVHSWRRQQLLRQWLHLQR